jgi:hypothetical protein
MIPAISEGVDRLTRLFFPVIDEKQRVDAQLHGTKKN